VRFPSVIAIAVVVWVVTIRVAAGSFDGERIQRYLRERGCRLLSKRWTPFATGWLGEGSERLYSIRYRDRSGAVHAARAKTSMLSGVYLADDEIVQWPPSGETGTLAELRQENARLRREVEQLRRGG
jgi:hypothetical protein